MDKCTGYGFTDKNIRDAHYTFRNRALYLIEITAKILKEGNAGK